MPLVAVRRADLDEREVARAAAEVGDEHALIVIELRLVVVRGGDGLELEDDVGPADPREGLAEAARGEGLVLGGGGVREVNGATDDDARRRAARAPPRRARGGRRGEA